MWVNELSDCLATAKPNPVFFTEVGSLVKKRKDKGYITKTLKTTEKYIKQKCLLIYKTENIILETAQKVPRIMLSPHRNNVFAPVHLLTVWKKWTLQRGIVVTEIQMGLVLWWKAGISQMKDERTPVSRTARVTLTNTNRAEERFPHVQKNVYLLCLLIVTHIHTPPGLHC